MTLNSFFHHSNNAYPANRNMYIFDCNWKMWQYWLSSGEFLPNGPSSCKDAITHCLVYARHFWYEKKEKNMKKMKKKTKTRKKRKRTNKSKYLTNIFSYCVSSSKVVLRFVWHDMFHKCITSMSILPLDCMIKFPSSSKSVVFLVMVTPYIATYLYHKG